MPFNSEHDLDGTLDALLDAVQEHAGRFGDDLALLLMANIAQDTRTHIPGPRVTGASTAQ